MDPRSPVVAEDKLRGDDESAAGRATSPGLIPLFIYRALVRFYTSGSLHDCRRADHNDLDFLRDFFLS